jgi:hypothetical protein
MDACAACTLTPGRKRAATRNPRLERLADESSAAGMGVQASVWVSGGKQNPGGAMPTTV